MNVIAGISTLVLFGAIAWSSLARGTGSGPVFARGTDARATLVSSDPDLSPSTAATSSTPVGDAVLSQFASRFIALSQSGVASDTAATTAADIVPTLTAKAYTENSIPFDTDTSLARVLHYRSDLRTALAPLLNNTTPELDIYAQWIQTGDDQYLARLRQVADDYDAARSAAEKVRVPVDAVTYQIGILNAMSQFSAALRALADNAKDPVASLTLLRTYNMAEQQMFTAFNTLATYSSQKAR